MRAKVVKCTGDDFWYKNCEGIVLNVTDYNEWNYKVIDVYDSRTLLIMKRDCEVVEEEKYMNEVNEKITGDSKTDALIFIGTMCQPINTDNHELTRFKLKILFKTLDGLYNQ